MASSHAALVEAYLGPPDASSATSASRVNSFSSQMVPVLEAFSPRLQYAASDVSSIRSVRQAGPRKAPLSYAELAPYSARQSSRPPADCTPAVGSRTPSSIMLISGKSQSRAWNGVEASLVGHGGNHKSPAMDSASAYGGSDLQLSDRERRSHLGSRGTEITHATTPSWRSRSFPPAIDPATSVPINSMQAASIQTAPRRRLPPLPDEARQANPYSTPSEVRHLDHIDSAVHEANAMLVESFLNVKRKMSNRLLSGSGSYVDSTLPTASVESHDWPASSVPISPRYTVRRTALIPISDVSYATSRSSIKKL